MAKHDKTETQSFFAPTEEEDVRGSAVTSHNVTDNTVGAGKYIQAGYNGGNYGQGDYSGGYGTAGNWQNQGTNGSNFSTPANYGMPPQKTSNYTRDRNNNLRRQKPGQVGKGGGGGGGGGSCCGENKEQVKTGTEIGAQAAQGGGTSASSGGAAGVGVPSSGGGCVCNDSVISPNNETLQTQVTRKNSDTELTHWDASPPPTTLDRQRDKNTIRNLTNCILNRIQAIRAAAGDNNNNKRRADDLEAIYNNALRTIRDARSTGFHKSADNLQFFLNGTGGTIIEDLGFLMSYEVVANADQRLNRYVLNSTYKKMVELRNSLQNGQKRTFKYDEYAAAIMPPTITDLFYSSGNSYIRGHADVTIGKTSSGEIYFDIVIWKTWIDTYDWHPGLNARFMYVDDQDLARLEEEIGCAKRFEQRAYYKTELKGTPEGYEANTEQTNKNTERHHDIETTNPRENFENEGR